MKRGKPLKRTPFKRKKKSKKAKKKSDLQKKKDNPSSGYWKERADRAWKRWVHQTGKCEICGSTENLNAHHLISRGRIHLRHNPFNGICLCVGCHVYNNELSAHMAPLAFAAWLQENKPVLWQWAEENKNKPVGGPKPDYKAACEHLESLGETFYDIDPNTHAPLPEPEPQEPHGPRSEWSEEFRAGYDQSERDRDDREYWQDRD